jgi:FkbM family methyltransferase
MIELARQLRYLAGQDAFRRNPASVLGRLTAWRAISVMGRKKHVIDLPSYGVSMAVPSEWHGIAKLIFAYRDFYDRELVWLSKNVSPGSVTVDVGASFGIYTLVAARAAGISGQVFSFEPATAAFDILKANVDRNRLTNVHAFRCALGERDGEGELYHHRDSSRNSLAHAAGMAGTSESVHLTTLGKVLDTAGVEKVDLIKIDVEGTEELVLKGCSTMVRRARPKIIIELSPARASAIGLRADGAWQLLASLGYKMYEIASGGRLCRVERSPQRLINVVAFPE